MVQTYLVKLVGWCHDAWGNPSNLKGGVEPLEALARAVLEKKCRFVRITRQEADERMKRIEVGEILTPNKMDRESEESTTDDVDEGYEPDNSAVAGRVDDLPIPTPSSSSLVTAPPTHPTTIPITLSSLATMPPAMSPVCPTASIRVGNGALAPAPHAGGITDDLIDPGLRAGEGEYFIQCTRILLTSQPCQLLRQSQMSLRLSLLPSPQ